jgi:hypothetical protein
VNGSPADFAAAVDKAFDTDTATSLLSPYAAAVVVMGPAQMLVRMPDGTCAWGAGLTYDEAEADACRVWRNWKFGPPMRREYRRRLQARRRRNRR